MNYRHVAALALLGWYLMVPRFEHQGDRMTPADGAPLSTWTVSYAFDTAAECQAGKRSDQEVQAKRAKENPSNEYFQALSEGSFRSQCIASDDPRLREK
jgi:hypothetical protein